ncbi:TLC domain-containing protein 4-B [Linum grandiflorum]
MEEVGLLFIPIVENATTHLLVSALVGILMCRAVYKLTGYASLLWFKSYYNKLTAKQKMEWNNRGFSTFHAIFAALLSLYLVLLSDLFKDDDQDVMMIDKYSVLSNSVLGVSVGYFLTDLAMIVWCYPVLGGVEYVSGSSAQRANLRCFLPNEQFGFFSTLFLSWLFTALDVFKSRYLDVAGQKTSKLYIYNGVMLFLGWLVSFLKAILSTTFTCKLHHVSFFCHDCNTCE